MKRYAYFITLSVFFCVLLRPPWQTQAFNWTSTVLDGSQIEVCEGESVTFPWSACLANDERLEQIHHYRLRTREPLNNTDVQRYGDGEQIAITDPRFRFQAQNFSLHIQRATVNDSGIYTLALRVADSGKNKTLTYRSKIILSVRDVAPYQTCYIFPVWKAVTYSNCRDMQKLFPESGVRTLNIYGRHVNAYCDQTTAGGGWTVIQRRMNGAVDFYRGWEEYVKGFGDPSSEYWLGLRNIYRMTSSARYTLRVDLEDFTGNTTYFQYAHFSISGPQDNYRLSVFGLLNTEGPFGYELSYHNNRKFSTKDRDHDLYIGNSCARMKHGGWWYAYCASVNLNGRYKSSGSSKLYGLYEDGIYWKAWKGEEPLKRAEMKIRPA